MAFVLLSLGDVARAEGGHARARGLLPESLTTTVGAGDRLGIGRVLGVFAHLAADEGQAERAVRLADAAAREREIRGTRAWPVEERRRAWAAGAGGGAAAGTRPGARPARRELVRLAVTTHPAAAWVWRPVVEATPWGCRPEHLLRDRDTVYGGALRERARGLGIEPVRTPVRAPRANAGP
jgi:hypothetical protein